MIGINSILKNAKNKFLNAMQKIRLKKINSWTQCKKFAWKFLTVTEISSKNEV